MIHGWQIALSVIGGILLLLLTALCFGSVSARISYDGNLIVRIYVLGFLKTIYPDLFADKPLKDILRANPNRLLKKEQKRLRCAEKKAKRKRLKAAKKAQKPQQKTTAQPTPNLKENLDMILAIFKRTYSLTKGKICLEFRKMHLHVATGDAASTAILYGVILQSAACLLQWVQDHFNDICRRDGDMTIEPDFLSETSSLELDLRLRIRLFRAIGMALGLYRVYLVETRRAKKRAKQRVAAQKSKHN